MAADTTDVFSAANAGDGGSCPAIGIGPIGIGPIGIGIDISDAYNFWNWSRKGNGPGPGPGPGPNGPGPNGPGPNGSRPQDLIFGVPLGASNLAEEIVCYLVCVVGRVW